MVTKKFTLVFSILFIGCVVVTSASPISAEDETTSKQSGNVTHEAQNLDVEDLPKEEDEQDKKTKECTLQAFQVIISSKRGHLDEDCQNILRQLIKSKEETSEQIDRQNDVDLRDELKQLADVKSRYEQINEEIEKEQDMLPEKKSSRNEEITSPGKMNDKKVETKTDENDSQQPAKSATLYEDGFSLGNEDENYGFVPARFSSETKGDVKGNTMLDATDNSMNKNRIEMPASERKPHQTMEEDFLVVPLRFLQQQLKLSNPNYPKDAKVSEEDKLETKDGGASDDEKALKWAMRSILDRINDESDQKFLESFPKEDNENSRDIFSPHEPEDPAQKSLLFSDGKSPKRHGSEAESAEKQSIEKNDFDRERNYEEARQKSMKVLSEVEEEISRLGEGLRRLENLNQI